ncbi:OTU-domain-containing protein [Amylocystis lapponica]|nr:OTU-domain-containing protein [Amylocystis lapponica]
MAPIRLRHPKGVSTLQVDLDSSTVLDLQQAIFSTTEIPPSAQDLKAGYPPHPLTLVPELPLESLGLKPGEQLIVTQKPAIPHATRPTSASGSPMAAMTGLTASQVSERAAPAGPTRAGGPDAVRVDGGLGYLVHRIVPDDNACLFHAVALVFEQDIGKAPQMRQIVADAIRKDPETWTEAILGRPREEYAATILRASSWGGAIELAVLAAHYGTEIASVDVETGRIDHFAPPAARASGSRCVLVYSGIHYDAASVAPAPDAPPAFHETIVPVGAGGERDPVLGAARRLADVLRARRAYTNTATFDLKCEICGKGLKGEKEARAHASETGHAEFGEY